ncbi:type 4 pilus major pilin [Dickeya oryzae]|uniref:type 4 pilus major pilin n=1 Tax=Dickeya oryzae TaxID=1240404 RepID=UPI00315E8CEA
MSVSVNQRPHRGWAILEHGTVAVLIIIVVAYVASKLWDLWFKKDVAVETTNIQTLVSNGRAMKSNSGYNFTSGTTMTGTLIQVGGAPKGMTVQGTASSGTATLWNSYGGQVVVAPVATSGFNNGFSVTYPRVPQADCISIAQQLGGGGAFASITINSTAFSDGAVSAEDAGKSCQADSGRTGNNTLVFTVNG